MSRQIQLWRLRGRARKATEPAVRLDAIKRLLLTDPVGSLSTFEKVLASDTDDAIRTFVVKALGERHLVEAVSVLIQATHDEFWEVRSQAAVALGAIGDRAAVGALRQLLSDRAADVRLSALDSLAKIGGGQALAGLLDALGHGDLRTRERAEKAIGDRELPASERAECVAAVVEALAASNSDVRLGAALLAARWGLPEAAENLLAGLDHPQIYRRRAVVIALGQLGQTQHIDALVREAERTPELSLPIGQALGRLGADRQRREVQMRYVLLRLPKVLAELRITHTQHFEWLGKTLAEEFTPSASSLSWELRTLLEASASDIPANLLSEVMTLPARITVASNQGCENAHVQASQKETTEQFNAARQIASQELKARGINREPNPGQVEAVAAKDDAKQKSDATGSPGPRTLVATCACGRQFRFSEEHSGRRAKCPRCGAVIVLPKGI